MLHLASKMGTPPPFAKKTVPPVPASGPRNFSAGARQSLADKGQAMPDGSFPIPDVDALKRAIKLAGNAKDPAAAKAHIKNRAKALGATNLIPSDW